MADLPRTLRVEEMPSGQVYGYVLPNVHRLLLSGYFPGPVADIAREVVSGRQAPDDRGTMTDKEIEVWEDFEAHVVAWMVRTEDGEVRPRRDAQDKPILDPAAVASGSRMLYEMEVVGPGSPVTYTPEQVKDPDGFPQDDKGELFLRAMRSKPAPKATRVET